MGNIWTQELDAHSLRRTACLSAQTNATEAAKAKTYSSAGKRNYSFAEPAEMSDAEYWNQEDKRDRLWAHDERH